MGHPVILIKTGSFRKILGPEYLVFDLIGPKF